jgi:hypothetical protein
VIFIKDKARKPADYAFVYLQNDAEIKRYRNGKFREEETFKDNEGVSRTWEQMENVQFNIPTKGKDITDANLVIAFTLLKRAQTIMKI